MHEGSGLERVVRRLGRHAGSGELPQLVVDERQQVGRGFRIAGRDRIEKLGDVSHVG